MTKQELRKITKLQRQSYKLLNQLNGSISQAEATEITMQLSSPILTVTELEQLLKELKTKFKTAYLDTSIMAFAKLRNREPSVATLDKWSKSADRKLAELLK